MGPERAGLAPSAASAGHRRRVCDSGGSGRASTALGATAVTGDSDG